jgi:hypothetical protein
VDHPAVVHHYRTARDIARRDQAGGADTEALRQAVVHYRALFSELLEVEEPPPAADARARQRDSRAPLRSREEPARAARDPRTNPMEHHR